MDLGPVSIRIRSIRSRLQLLTWSLSLSLSLSLVCVCVSQDFYDAWGVVGVAFMIAEKARGRGKEARRCQWYERR
jgi:hypothetical protein